MSKRNVDCFLCEEKAIEQDSPVLTNIIVNCNRCKRYELTDEAVRFYFKAGILNDKHKTQLAKYVQENYDPETDEPILLNTDRIKEITGVESVHIQYK